MNRSVLALVLAGGGLAVPRLAHAQDIPGEITTVEGTGYPVGEGTVVHPTLGSELGFTDNVFYGDRAANRHASGILRLIAEAAIASKEIKPDEGQPDEFLDPSEEAPAEPAHQKLTYRAGGRLSYQEYLSPKDYVRAQRDLAADILGNVVVAPQGTVAFSVNEHFTRDTRPTNYVSTNGTDRDANALALDLKYQPGGRQITAGLRWENQIDFFEASTQRFANRMINTLHARGEWMFFPYSKAYADFSYGFVGGFGSGGGMGLAKRSAQPIRGGVGIATALTEDFTVKVHAGWSYASYSDGASYNLPLLGAEVGYRYSPVGRVVAEYDWDQQDSVNADFYSDQALKAHIDHQFGRLVASVKGDVHWRRYGGVDPGIGGTTARNDLLFSAGADGQYMFRDWLAAVLAYRTEIDSTSFRAQIQSTDDPSYVRTEVTLGVRAAL